MQGAGIIAFHDFDIVGRAISDFLRETPRHTRGYFLSSNVFVVELGSVPSLLGDANIQQQLRIAPVVWTAANHLGAVRWLIAADVWRRRRAEKAAGD